MGSGQWEAVNGKRSMASGQWQAANGKRPMGSGQWEAINGKRPMGGVNGNGRWMRGEREANMM